MGRAISTDLTVVVPHKCPQKELAVSMWIYSFKKVENECGESSNNDCGIRGGASKAVDYLQIRGIFFRTTGKHASRVCHSQIFKCVIWQTALAF